MMIVEYREEIAPNITNHQEMGENQNMEKMQIVNPSLLHQILIHPHQW